ncbi:MAG: hypothetical protein JST80_06540 [Bdellovibrionales bacterium]|nr:hypothetical protein [Bdellovibrionales bacterium]
MQKLALFYLLLLSTAASAAGHDRFNAYQWDPANRGPWYEWWYYKVVDPVTTHAFYWVYGVVNPWDQKGTLKGTRASVAIGDFSRKINLFKNYPIADFDARRDQTLVRIGDNIATQDSLKGQIETSEGLAEWDVRIEKSWGFNAMSWAMAVPKILNIYWYPAQASAKMSGFLRINGREVRFENAAAYQDRNWGSSFPKWWAWIVANEFENSPGTVLASGGGRPKILGHEPYAGMSIGLLHQGKEYKFRPNDGDIVQTDINFGKWEVTATKLGRYRISISARANREKFMLLPFITPDGDTYKDYETLNGNLSVQLFKYDPRTRSRWKLIADLFSSRAGIEYGSY